MPAAPQHDPQGSAVRARVIAPGDPLDGECIELTATAGGLLRATLDTSALATQATLASVLTDVAAILAKIIAAPATEATLAAAKADLDTLAAGVATAARQDTSNGYLSTLAASLAALVSANHADLGALHSDLSTTHADLVAILAKQPASPALASQFPTIPGATTPAASMPVTGSLATSQTELADVTATGTATAFGSLVAGASGIRIQNTSPSGGPNVRVGGASITLGPPARGVQLAPGQWEVFAQDNASRLYHIAESGSPTVSASQA